MIYQILLLVNKEPEERKIYMEERLSCCTKFATPEIYSPNEGTTCLEFKCIQGNTALQMNYYYQTEDGLSVDAMSGIMERILPVCAQCTVWKDLCRNTDNT